MRDVCSHHARRCNFSQRGGADCQSIRERPSAGLEFFAGRPDFLADNRRHPTDSPFDSFNGHRHRRSQRLGHNAVPFRKFRQFFQLGVVRV